MTKAKGLRKNLPDQYQPGYLAQLDRRTELFQRLDANFKNVAADLGGEAELSHIKSSLIERFIFLEAVLHKIESDLAAKPDAAPELLGKWIQAVNSLTGLAKTLGIERRASSPWAVVEAVHAESRNGHKPEGNGDADES